MSDSKVENSRKPGKPKGSPKSGGRLAGTPNKNSSTVRNGLDASNFNVIEKFIAAFENLTPEQQIAELRHLFKYVYPQLKEVETIPADTSPTYTNLSQTPTQDLLRLINPPNDEPSK